MRKDFHYTNGAGYRTGTMICAACRKPIGAEPYRYYETRDGFVNHHRACSSDDPGWVKVDAAAAREAKRRADLSRDAQALYDKWGILDIQDWVDTRPGRTLIAIADALEETK